MRRFTIILSIVFSTVFFSASLAADLPSVSEKFEAITINDGLSQGMINYILQDHFGFMWFATKDGVNRYDGYHFVIYRHDATDSTSIADSYVTWIFEDSRGYLWLSTAGHGLDLFDRNTEKFIHFAHDEKNPASLSNNVVSNIAEDKFGNIWVGTDYGLNKITIAENSKSKNSDESFDERFSVKIKHIYLDAQHPSTELYTKKEKNDLGLHTFCIDKNGLIWVSTFEMLFNIYPSKDDDKVEVLDVNNYFSYPFKDKGMETHAHSYVQDTIHNKLYLLASFCITEVDIKTKTARFISTQRNFTGFVDGQSTIDDNGILWINDSEHLLKFDIARKEAYVVTSKDLMQGEMVNAMNTIYRDKSGVIWLGTKGYGLLKYNPQSAKFHHTDNASIRWMSMLNDSLIAFIKTHDYLHVFNYHTGQFADTIPHKKVLDQRIFNGFGYQDAIVYDSDGSYWICKGRLLHYDPNKETLNEYPTDNHSCFPVFEDHHHNIWIGNESTFSCLDKKTEKFVSYKYPIPAPNVPYSFLVCIYEDSGGIFWLGTVKGLLRFNPADKSWMQFANNPSDNNSLSFDVVFSILPDPVAPENYLWIGTNGGGLNRLDKHTGKFTQVTEKDGLPNNVIYGILSDENKNLWLSTNKGISCYNPLTKAFKNFEAKDGLQSNEFNRHAFCKSPGGILFFGGVNGFNYFDPKELKLNPFVPPVIVTDIKLKNQSVNFKDNNSVINKPPYLTRQISLPYSDNVITYEFASMEFSAPDKNVYRYMMEGFDKEWIQAGTNHVATYTNLDPGKYTFRVKGSNNDAVWNEEGASLELIILPPWYMTWWFRALLAITIAGSVYFVYRYRLSQALNLQVVRNRIAQDLHDEVGSNLSSIAIFADMATSRSEKSGEVIPLLTKINDYTQTSMEAMSDIVWMINSLNDRFENIIIHMRTHAAELFEAKNYVLYLNFDDALNSLKLGMDERKNFYLIYKEVLNNIVKYAEGKQVWIDLVMDHSMVHLSIKDDGIGFDVNNPRHGNGLINMQKRSEVLKGILKIDSAPGAGTTVVLKFSV